jgi:hypothetical protein
MQSQNTLKNSTYIGPKLADSLAERCAPVFPTIEVSFKLSNKGYRKIWLSMCQSFFFGNQWKACAKCHWWRGEEMRMTAACAMQHRAREDAHAPLVD